MLVTRPDYFDRFRCIASACPDSCCKEWDVQVDEISAGLYRSLPGPLGDRLRQVLRDEDGQTVMTIVNGRCPMWQEDGLCRLQAELGEHGLCQVCRDFPRLTHDYGDFGEQGLELSCPEAARLILTAAPGPRVTEDRPGGGTADYDREAMAVLKATREQVLDLLSDPSHCVEEALTLAFLYGCQAQGALDSGEILPFDPAAALETARELAAPGSMEDLLDFFRELEILTPDWKETLNAPSPAPWESRHLALARYLAERYWLQAVSDFDLYSRVKFITVTCLVVRHLGGDLFRTAQLYSKEIENNIDNLDALLDAAYDHPAFTDAKLLGLLSDGKAGDIR